MAGRTTSTASLHMLGAGMPHGSEVICWDGYHNYEYDYEYDDAIQVMWGQGQLPPGSVPMWGPGMPGEIISLMLMNYLDFLKCILYV